MPEKSFIRKAYPYLVTAALIAILAFLGNAQYKTHTAQKAFQKRLNDIVVTYMQNDSGAGQFAQPGALFKAITQPAKPAPAKKAPDATPPTD